MAIAVPANLGCGLSTGADQTRPRCSGAPSRPIQQLDAYRLIDVREPHEWGGGWVICPPNLASPRPSHGKSGPLAQGWFLPHYLSFRPAFSNICEAILVGFSDVTNLKGGMIAWNELFGETAIMMHDILMATIGGALIGMAASMLLLFQGRIAGISGIIGGLLQQPGKDILASLVRGWTLTGGVALVLLAPDTLLNRVPALWVRWPRRIAGGFWASAWGKAVRAAMACAVKPVVQTLPHCHSQFMATGFATATLIQTIGGTI